MRKTPEKLTVRRPVAQYQDLASMLCEQNRGDDRLGNAYAKLASAIEMANGYPARVVFALLYLFEEIAARSGRQTEVALHLSGFQLSEEEHARWLIDFLIQQEDRSRYNKTLVDACKIAGEALRVHAELPKVEWNRRYRYATPPNLARRIPAPI